MKKIYWMGLLATLLLGGCSEEDGLNSGNGGNELLGEQAYLTVRIMDAGANTKATDGGFDYGSAAEHAVSDAQFFFYNKDEKLVTKANVWDGGSSVEGEGGKPDENIEFNGKTVIVLRGLTETDYPKYMVTVLNAPSGFTPGNTLTEMLASKSGGIYMGPEDETKYFIMSTTSYAHNEKVEVENESGSTTLPYSVTELITENFQPEPIITPDEKKVVKVYVERLAAKVTLQLAPTLKPNTNGVYQLENVTIAGEDNAEKEEEGSTTTEDTENEGTGEDEISTPPAEGSTEVYMKIEGWGLNATAKDSYMMKNIDAGWTDDELGFNWNDEANYRSYWGESYNYEDTGYPGSAVEVKVADKLTYISGDDIENSLGSSAYCAENTFPTEIAKKASARTSILLKAVLCDETGNPLEVVRYNGMLFKQDYYISYVMNALKNKNNLNAYVLISGTAGETDAKYKQIDESYVELVNIVDGKVKVQLKKDLTETLYKRVVKDEKTTYTPYDTDGADKKALNTTLEEFNKDVPAIGYNDGQMYYNIPIEHLRAFETNQTDPKEGNYGVVRNHHYVVTINSLENVGKGIFDPDEVIVPGDDETVYYVGASIHILSWKIVNQGVDL